MRNSLRNLRAAFNSFRETVFNALFRARFRYDIFISYLHSDARQYAEALKQQLGNLDFACFIDKEESPPGLSLGPTLEKALQKSAVLALGFRDGTGTGELSRSHFTRNLGRLLTGWEDACNR